MSRYKHLDLVAFEDRWYMFTSLFPYTTNDVKKFVCNLNEHHQKYLWNVFHGSNHDMIAPYNNIDKLIENLEHYCLHYQHKYILGITPSIRIINKILKQFETLQKRITFN